MQLHGVIESETYVIGANAKNYTITNYKQLDISKNLLAEYGALIMFTTKQLEGGGQWPNTFWLRALQTCSMRCV